MASLQRLVAFMVMFHETGKRVQDFWPSVSFGMLGYDMDRTHSIMRIATTASPIAATDVRNRMQAIAEEASLAKAEIILGKAFVTLFAKVKKKRNVTNMKIASNEEPAATAADIP
eukprot:gene5905-7107_t